MSEGKIDLPRRGLPDKIKRIARNAITVSVSVGTTIVPSTATAPDAPVDTLLPESSHVGTVLPEQQQARAEISNKLVIPDVLAQRVETVTIDEAKEKVDSSNNEILTIVKQGINENNRQQLINLTRTRSENLITLMRNAPDSVRPRLLQEKLSEEELAGVQNIEGIQVEILRQIEGEFQLQAVHYREGGERIIPKVIAQDQEFILYSLFSDRIDSGEINTRVFEIGSNVIAQGNQLGPNIFVDSLTPAFPSQTR